jgi:hypothetical protein
MATRSTISIQLGENKFKQIYCHWDGYLSNNGRLLLEHYNTRDKVEQLIALGDLSILAEILAPNEGEVHTFDKPIKGVCVAYGRDRGEDYKQARELDSNNLQCEEYNYVFTLENKWTLFFKNINIDANEVLIENYI